MTSVEYNRLVAYKETNFNLNQTKNLSPTKRQKRGFISLTISSGKALVNRNCKFENYSAAGSSNIS